MRYIARFLGWRPAQRLAVCACVVALLPIAYNSSSDKRSVVVSATSPNIRSHSPSRSPCPIVRAIAADASK